MDYNAILEGLLELDEELGPGALVIVALARGYRWRYGTPESSVVAAFVGRGGSFSRLPPPSSFTPPDL